MQGLISFLLFAAFFYFMMRFGCGAHMVHGHGGQGGHGPGKDLPIGSGIDPVCRMPVIADQGYTKIHQGRQYRFCSRVCLEKFDANPTRYLTQSGGAR